jgi:hypothetical protein
MTGWRAIRQGIQGEARGQVAPPNRRPVPMWDRPGLNRPAKADFWACGRFEGETDRAAPRGLKSKSRGFFQGQNTASARPSTGCPPVFRMRAELERITIISLALGPDVPLSNLEQELM